MIHNCKKKAIIINQVAKNGYFFKNLDSFLQQYTIFQNDIKEVQRIFKELQNDDIIKKRVAWDLDEKDKYKDWKEYKRVELNKIFQRKHPKTNFTVSPTFEGHIFDKDTNIITLTRRTIKNFGINTHLIRL